MPRKLGGSSFPSMVCVLPVPVCPYANMVPKCNSIHISIKKTGHYLPLYPCKTDSTIGKAVSLQISSCLHSGSQVASKVNVFCPSVSSFPRVLMAISLLLQLTKTICRRYYYARNNNKFSIKLTDLFTTITFFLTRHRPTAHTYLHTLTTLASHLLCYRSKKMFIITTLLFLQKKKFFYNKKF